MHERDPKTAASQLLMRRHNLSLALGTILNAGVSTRAALARSTGLSKPAVTRIVGDLIDAGFVSELAPEAVGDRGRGRPASRLVPRDDAHVFLGVDLRLDRTVVQARSITGTVLAETAVPAAAPTSAELVRSLSVTVADFVTSFDRPVGGIGVAVGGMVDDRGERIIGSAHTEWRDVPLAEHLRRAVGDPTVPVRVADVARCAALANWREIAGDPRLRDLVHLQIGVGAGAGWIGRQRSIPDPRVPGPVAHLPLDPNGPVCACGARGCLDAMVGFPAFVDLAGIPGPAAATGPQAMAAYCAEILRRADQDEERAGAAIETMAVRVADAATILVSLFQPSSLTLGGYPLMLGERFRSAFLRGARRRIRDIDAITTETGLGDEASVMGAHLLGVAAAADDPLRLTSPRDQEISPPVR